MRSRLIFSILVKKLYVAALNILSLFVNINLDNKTDFEQPKKFSVPQHIARD